MTGSEHTRRRLLLIDGTNFFFKGTWSGNRVLTRDGTSVGYLYAFYVNVCSLLRLFEKDARDTLAVVCWDGGHAERTRISAAAVAAGIIPKTYKQERREARELLSDEEKRDRRGFIRQLETAEEFLSYTRIAQCRVHGEEADDLIGSLCRRGLGGFDDIVLVSTDKDCYQLLWDGVRIYNSGRKEFIDRKFLHDAYGLERAEQWVDVGALAGESGPSSDTICGVPGIGTTTGAGLIRRYGSAEGVLRHAEERFGDYIRKNGYDAFRSRIRSGEYRPKDHLREAKVLAYRDVLEIALKLKRINTELNLSVPAATPDWRGLEQFLSRMNFQFSRRNFDILLRGGGA